MNLETEKLLNTELIHDDTSFHKFIQVHETKEDKAVILAKNLKFYYI